MLENILKVGVILMLTVYFVGGDWQSRVDEDEQCVCDYKDGAEAAGT